MIPSGYAAFDVGRARLVVRDEVTQPVRRALAAGSLYEWAERARGATALAGRQTVWAATLTPGVDVVVRHSRHGGVFAPITGDVFFAPTRAPLELANALWLESRHVPTPPVLAYAVYPLLGTLARADVMTGRVLGDDLAEAWRSAPDESRVVLVRAVAHLLRAMTAAGAVHPDLNIKNILVSPRAHGVEAVLLDVDRVERVAARSTGGMERNLARLRRSAEKVNRLRGLGLDDAHFFEPLRDALREPRA